MKMKRRRKSASSKTQMSKKDDDRIQISGPSITNLPVAMVVDIVLKLPVKSIVMCKSVCKTWRGLISEPLFVELHLARSKTHTLIRNENYLSFSRSLYLLEPEDVCGLDSGYCKCRANWAGKCKRLHFNTTVASKLKIPLRNSQVMLDKVENRHGDDAMFCVARNKQTENLIVLESDDHRYKIANSCNGLLLVYKTKILRLDVEDDSNPIVVCNPLSGEFIYLPEDYNGLLRRGGNFIEFGFGFSPKDNQYKAIRMSRQWTKHPENDLGWFDCIGVAQIHTLGTDAWRSLDIPAFKLGHLRSPAYLDGALYWIFEDVRGSFKLASLDLDQEIFQVHSVPSPLTGCNNPESTGLSIRVLGGRLYLYTNHGFTHIVIWVMDGTGASKSWINLFLVDVSKFHCFRKVFPYQLISCLNEEAFVMLGGPFSEFVYYDKLEGPRSKQLKFQSLKSDLEAISCTPSFISLKDVVKQTNVEVLNINSGCGKLKLLEETFPLLIRGARN